MVAVLVAASGAEPPPSPDKTDLDDLLSPPAKPAPAPKGTKDDVDDLVNTLRQEPAGKPGQRPADARPPDKPGMGKPASAALPKHFDKLDLTDAQKERVRRVSEAYDDRIAALRARLDALARIRAPAVVSVQFTLAVAARKLTAQRHQELMNILSDEQKTKLQALIDASGK